MVYLPYFSINLQSFVQTCCVYSCVRVSFINDLITCVNLWCVKVILYKGVVCKVLLFEFVACKVVVCKAVRGPRYSLGKMERKDVMCKDVLYKVVVCKIIL